jgi:4-hydroxybenzoate polyprenyltransferase
VENPELETPAAMADRASLLRQVRHVLEMIRFSHTVFALPFALLAALMAWTAGARGEPRVAFRWQDLLGIVLCMISARNAAMAFNRIADRGIDAENPRTQARHIPAGILSVRSVSIFAIASGVSFILATLLFWPNWLPLALSGPVLAFLFAYSWTKRFTAAAHFWLGASLMLAPLAAWIAIRGEVVIGQPADLLPAATLGMAVLLWVAGFDVIYSCQDAEFDRRRGLHSLPAHVGVARSLRIAAACHGGTVLMLFALPWVYPWLGLVYISGIAAVALLLAYEHSLVRADDLTRVNIAFFHVNAIVSIGLLAVAALDLLT